MSQAKVDRYKAEKANRKEIMKKEKRMKVIRNVTASVVVVAVIGWIGYSGYTSYVNNQPAETAEVDYSAVADYLSNMYAAE